MKIEDFDEIDEEIDFYRDCNFPVRLDYVKSIQYMSPYESRLKDPFYYDVPRYILNRELYAHIKDIISNAPNAHIIPCSYVTNRGTTYKNSNHVILYFSEWHYFFNKLEQEFIRERIRG